MTLGLIGILISLVVLVGMAYRGHSVVAIAPLASAIAVLFAGAPVLATYTQIFMPALGGFITAFLPLFLAGAIFGRLMTISGYAEDLARWIPRVFGVKRAILVTGIITALLTYGGVSTWVIAFTIVPIAKALFARANISLRLMPAAIALGMFTFATAALPGTPQIHNTIPSPYFGTTTFAAPVLGLIATAIMIVLGLAWLTFREHQLRARGEGYTDLSPAGAKGAGDDDNAISARAAAQEADSELHERPAPGTEQSEMESLATATDQSARTAARSGHDPLTLRGDEHLSNRAITTRGLIGLLPILTVIITNALYVYVIAPRLDTAYLATEKFGSTTLNSVLGVWAVTAGLVAAGVVILALKPHNFKSYLDSLTEGARNAVLPIATTASEVGYGAVIASLAAFEIIRNSLFDISENPLIVGSAATAVISGLTGSSSGGLSITMKTFGEQLAQLAVDQGINLEVMHRVIAMASVSFDSLPHNGAIVTLLLVCGMTHRQAYKDIAVVTVLVPFIGVVAILGLAMAFPGLV